MKLYDELVWRGLIKDVSSPELEKKLNEGGMTFYIGTDPTADSMHTGHFSSFLISTRLKKAGHNPILLIGGATGLIGDPKPTAERSIITKEEVNKNVAAMAKQGEDIFGFKVVNNYDWSKDINFIDFLRDYGKYFTVNYMLDKDIIKRRLETGITYTELSYMIMQALDFLYLYENENCTLQVAGSDQWGNMTAGIDLIRKKLGKEAYAFTLPLIVDANGNKIGKTDGNALWLDKNKTSSYELYQDYINTSDDMVIEMLKRLTFLTKEEIEELEQSLKEEPHLRKAHKVLGKEVIIFLHGEEEYNKAIKISDCLFSGEINKLNNDEIEDVIKTLNVVKSDKDKNIIDLLTETNICSSKREAREMLGNNAISINGEKVKENYKIDKLLNNKYLIIRKGKKNYFAVEV